MRLSLLLTSLLTVGVVNAQTHAAHEHGKARMNVALSAFQLNIELLAPADSFWGFEHAAKTPEQQAAEQKAIATLASASWLALPVAADCKLTSSNAARTADETRDDEHDHEAHKHNDGHEHEKARDGEQTTRHADVAVNLEYVCSKPSELIKKTAITLSLFQIFPGISTVNLMAITDLGQLAKALSAESGAFGLTQDQ